MELSNINPLLSIFSTQIQFIFISSQKDETLSFFSCPLKGGAAKQNCPVTVLQIT